MQGFEVTRLEVLEEGVEESGEGVEGERGLDPPDLAFSFFFAE